MVIGLLTLLGLLGLGCGSGQAAAGRADVDAPASEGPTTAVDTATMDDQIAARRTGPHVERAVRAFDSEPRRPGSAEGDLQNSPSPHASEGVDPLSLCRQAMARGESYSGCIIERLEGRAHTPRGLHELISAYRTEGDTEKARQHIQLFVERFPDDPRARRYEELSNEPSDIRH